MRIQVRDGWRLNLLTLFYAFIILRPGLRFWYWPRIIYYSFQN